MLTKSILRSFAKIKPLKVQAVTSEKGVKFTSQTNGSSYEIHDALENLLGSLARCEVAAINALTTGNKSNFNNFKVSGINFTRL